MTQNHEIVLTLQNGKLRARCDTTDCVLTNTSIVLHLSLDNISLHFVDLHRNVMRGSAMPGSHRGSTLLRFHLDWARTSHQWRWCPSRWWLPPDHQMFTIFLIASCLGLQKYFGLGKSTDFCLSSITVWLYLCIGKVDTTSSSSTHDPDHHCEQDDHAGCIGELDPGGSLVSDATRLDNHETLLIHRL